MSKQLTITDLDLLEQLCILESREDFYAFRKFMHPKMKTGWFTKEISKELQSFYKQFINGERPKLAISAPPQHGKSSAIVDFVAWMVGKAPDKRTIFTSFSDRLGVRANSAIQRMIKTERYQKIFPETQIGNICNQEIIEINDGEGYFRNTTVRGAITGESLDCMPSGTMINTDCGLVDIKDFTIESLSRYNILSLNHKTGLLSYEKVSNFKKLERIGLLRFTTKSGRVFECTEDHRIYTKSRGYIQAHNISKGEAVLRLLQSGFSEDSSCNKKMDYFWSETQLLLERLSTKTQANLHESFEILQGLSSRVAKANRRALSLLFGQTQINSNCHSKSSKGRKVLSNLSEEVCNKICSILQSILRKYCSFYEYERQEKSKLEQWFKRSKIFRIFNEGIQSNTTIDIKARWKQMCSLFKYKYEVRSSPHRWMACKSLFKQFDNFMHFSSRGNTQIDEREWRVIEDEITDIQRINTNTTVYDITVNGNHNFFANGILVHNCGIIDDPLKGREAANSETVRNSVWDWLTDDFLTRFSDEAGLLIVMTRWHIDDPLSRLIETLGDSLKIINFQAIAEQDEKYRKAGEPLFPQLKSLEFLNTIKTIMDKSARGSWIALFQGSPKQQGGELLHGYWFKRYTQLPIMEQRVIYADTAQKTKERNDYSVFELWGKGIDGRIYLIDLIRGKWEAPELERKCVDFWNKHAAIPSYNNGQLRAMKIEDKASGTGLIQKLKTLIDPLIPVIPIPRDKDKYTRYTDIAGYVEAGYVYLPENAPWVVDFVTEAEAFTSDDSHLHDDQLDPMFDAINDLVAPQGELGIWSALGKR